MKIPICFAGLLIGSIVAAQPFEAVKADVIKSNHKMVTRYTFSKERVVIEGPSLAEAMKALTNECLNEEGPEMFAAKSILITSISTAKPKTNKSEIYRLKAICKF